MKRLGEKKLALADLARFPGNARIHADAELRASIRKFGQYRPLTVRVADGSYTILAGNGTADALAAEGHDKADCALLECDDHEARQINLADNKLSDMATDDRDALAELLSYLEGDYEGTGWTVAEVDKLIEPPGFGEDAPVDEITPQYGVIIDCSSEEEQLRLLERLGGEGLSCRALMA